MSFDVKNRYSGEVAIPSAERAMSTASSTRKKKKIAYVCDFCGSEEVLVDAWAQWDKDSQRWELFNTFDAAFCAECDGECSVAARETH